MAFSGKMEVLHKTYVKGRHTLSFFHQPKHLPQALGSTKPALRQPFIY